MPIAQAIDPVARHECTDSCGGELHLRRSIGCGWAATVDTHRGETTTTWPPAERLLSAPLRAANLLTNLLTPDDDARGRRWTSAGIRISYLLVFTGPFDPMPDVGEHPCTAIWR